MTFWPLLQIATIVTFITTLFILYRVYIEQKDATIMTKDAVIEVLTEKNAWLEKQLEIAKQSSPDALLKQLDQRMKIYADELDRLSHDKNMSDALLKEKEEELQKLKESTQRAINTLNDARRTIVEVLHEEQMEGEAEAEAEAEAFFVDQEIDRRRGR